MAIGTMATVTGPPLISADIIGSFAKIDYTCVRHLRWQAELQSILNLAPILGLVHLGFTTLVTSQR
ncbi:hypothetical protein TcasGA2_TC010340 [Tribolium castaneum]|uniref:Uncharacterized protein n=1 Tax=Tribolium castaneum TaxID=7070 RepID=D6WGC9_TRICA|nr:hypothetical protein TcasGA2_TC010340 [Tribolium castaneum]